jgi:hypothetical protein
VPHRVQSPLSGRVRVAISPMATGRLFPAAGAVPLDRTLHDQIKISKRTELGKVARAAPQMSGQASGSTCRSADDRIVRGKACVQLRSAQRYHSLSTISSASLSHGGADQNLPLARDVAQATSQQRHLDCLARWPRRLFKCTSKHDHDGIQRRARGNVTCNGPALSSCRQRIPSRLSSDDWKRCTDYVQAIYTLLMLHLPMSVAAGPLRSASALAPARLCRPRTTVHHLEFRHAVRIPTGCRTGLGGSGSGRSMQPKVETQDA